MIGAEIFHRLSQADTHCASAPEQDAIDQDTAADRQVGTTASRCEVRQRRALPHAGDGVHRRRASAQRPRCIVIIRAGITARGAGIQERPLRGGQLFESIAADRERPVPSVPLVVDIGIVFQAAEKRQHLGERPAEIAEPRPFVIVAGRASEGYRRVRRGSAAHQFRVRQMDRPTAGTRFAGVSPVVSKGRTVTRRDFGRQGGGVRIIWASFEE